jgi:ribosomal 30S subunit maturation factor RimM
MLGADRSSAPPPGAARRDAQRAPLRPGAGFRTRKYGRARHRYERGRQRRTSATFPAAHPRRALGPQRQERRSHRLSGCDSISQAEELAGQIVLLPADSMPALDSDTFYVGDLVGCAFFDGNTLIGRIVDVQFATAPDGRTRLEDAAPLLGVELLASNPSVESAPVDPILVPFVRAWLESVDLSARRIVMQLPAGLFDLPSEEAPDED